MLIELPAPTAAGLKVAVVGGGLMGHALAAVMLAAGSEVTVFEPHAALRATLPARMNAVLAECGTTQNAATAVRVIASLDGLPATTQFVIEAVPEDLLLKQELFGRLDTLLPQAILATNSSVYRVADVSSGMSEPSRAIGTHWWNPPHLIPIVEVIQGTATPAETITWMMNVLRSAGKTAVHVRKDTPGFIGNRMQHALWREALALVEEGIADAGTVDLVVRNTLGLKLGTMGPLENADYVGLDLTYAIHEYLLPALSRSTTPSPLLIEALAERRLGAKSGSGLIGWPKGRKDQVADRLAKHVRKQLSDTAREG